MRRYLTLALAREQGVAASLAFPTPTELLHLLIGMPTDDPWHRGALAWRIAAALSQPALTTLLPAPLRRTMTDADPLPRLTFVRRVAASLHNLMVHRPAVVIGWERGDAEAGAGSDEHWQRALWEALQQMLRTPSPMARYLTWCEGTAATHSVAPTGLLLVADATLPPLLRDVLTRVSATTPIHWYLLSPTLLPFTPAQPHRRAAALTAVRALPNVSERPGTAAHRPTTDTLLGVLQGALASGPSTSTPHAWTAADESLLLHRCHSPLREIETLRDHLAARLAADRTLAPEDVTLYVTSLPEYLSAVDAVFGVAEPGYQTVPYQVAGRPWHQRAPVGAAVTALWDALTGRFGRSAILGLLDHQALRRASGLRGTEVPKLRELVESVWIRWGVDATDRADRYGLPAQAEGTWAAGLDRLTAQHQSLLDDEPEPGSDAELVLRLRRWIERLVAGRATLLVSRSASDWADALAALLADLVFTTDSEDTAAFQDLLRGMRHLLHELGALDGQTPLDFDTLRPLLLQAVEQRASTGHLRGGMRVCRLEPGTILPARVVLIAGLDDAHFPPRSATPAWDLLHQSHAMIPRDPASWEDPDPREDALGALQDALLSARDGVHLSWTGRSILDNALRAPSIAVDALLDLVDRLAAPTGGGSMRQAIVTGEPLQPFAPILFGEPDAHGSGRSPRPSAASRWAAVARTLAEHSGGGDAVTFLADPLPAASGPDEVTLDELADALAHPIQYYWTRTLDLPRPPRALDDEDREPVLRDDHEDITIATRWLEQPWLAVDRALAQLPSQVEVAPGALGRAVLSASVAPLSLARETLAQAPACAPRRIDLQVEGVRITGALDQVEGGGMTLVVPYPVGTKTLLRAWVRHLALNAVGGAVSTRVIGVGEKTGKMLATFLPVEQPLPRFADVVALHQTLRRELVFLPPRLGMDTAEDLLKGKELHIAALTRWQGGNHSGRPGLPERDEPIIQRLLEGHDFGPATTPQYWAAFAHWTERLLVPLREHLEQEA